MVDQPQQHQQEEDHEGKRGLDDGLNSSGGEGGGSLNSGGGGQLFCCPQGILSFMIITYRNHGLGNLIVVVCAHGALQGDPADGGRDHSLWQQIEERQQRGVVVRQ